MSRRTSRRADGETPPTDTSAGSFLADSCRRRGSVSPPSGPFFMQTMPVTTGMAAKAITAQRHPHQSAKTGSSQPPRKIPIWAPACFTPTTRPWRPGSNSVEINLFVAGLEIASAIPVRTAAPTSRENSGAIPTESRASPATISVVTVERRPPATSAHLPNRGENSAPPTVAEVASIPTCHRSIPMEEMISDARTPNTVLPKKAKAIVMANTVTKNRRPTFTCFRFEAPPEIRDRATRVSGTPPPTVRNPPREGFAGEWGPPRGGPRG